jgi:hypothetical protein
VVSVISEEYAKLFKYEGSRTDKHVREHEIYVVGESAAAFDQAKAGMVDRAATTNTKGNARSEAVSTGTFPFKRGEEFDGNQGSDSPGLAGLLRDPKPIMVVGGVLAAIVLALLFALSLKRPTGLPAEQAPVVAIKPAPVAAEPSAPVSPAPAAATGGGDQAATSLVNGADSTNDAQKAEQAKLDVARDEAAKAEAAKVAAAKTEAVRQASLQGVVTFSIDPWGYVFINGKLLGTTPPMKQTRLAPGKYKIEIKNGMDAKSTAFPPFVTNIEIKPKDEIGIKHKFQ